MKKQRRETAQIFDLTIKYVLQETSPAATVHLINGLFERGYDAKSPVRFRKTESVKKQGDILEQFRSDMIVSIGNDDFAVEFQIGNDELIGLRIFEYGLQYAYETKEVTRNGSLIKLSLPEGCVVYWENTPSTPDTITVQVGSKTHDKVFEYEVKVFKMADQDLSSLEERKLVVLLPFCLLKFRKDLKKTPERSEARQVLAQAERRMLDDLEGILERSRERLIISNGDCIMILESIAQMHKELYNPYPEFQEAGMVLDDRITLRWKAHETQLIAQERNKIISLFRQGYTPDEVEQLLAQEKTNPSTPPIPV